MSSVQIPCEWSCTRPVPVQEVADVLRPRSRIRACAGRTGRRAQVAQLAPERPPAGDGTPAWGRRGPRPDPPRRATFLSGRAPCSSRAATRRTPSACDRGAASAPRGRRPSSHVHLHEQVVGKVAVDVEHVGEARLGARVPPWARHDLRRDGAADDLAVLQRAVSRAGALVESTRARTNADVSPGRVARLRSSAAHGCSATGSIATQSAAMGHRAPPSAIGPREPRGSPSPRFLPPVLRRAGEQRGDR